MSPLSPLLNSHQPEEQIPRLRAIMHQLRGPEGCSWDREQTHSSLIPNLIEETYELIDSLRNDDINHVREELGDLLLQVIFHSELAQEAGNFTFEEVAQTLCEKLIRRHPHIFGDSSANTPEEVISQWDAIKREEKNTQSTPYLHGTGTGLPALLRAIKLQKKAGKVKFDWPDSESVIEKIYEELNEVQETRQLQEGKLRVEEELGDLLFAVANLCRKEEIDPEIALHHANQKFERRFHRIEEKLQQANIPLGIATLKQMDQLWNLVKKEEHPPL